MNSSHTCEVYDTMIIKRASGDRTCSSRNK